MITVKAGDRIQSAIDMAAAEASRFNKNVTVLLEEGVYNLYEPLRVHSGVSLVSEGRGRRSVRLVFKNPDSDTALVTVKNSYGSVFDGINIKAFGDANNVIGLLSKSNSSCVFRNFDIELLLGQDCVGLKHWRYKKYGESCLYEKFNIRSDGGCVEIHGGDNNCFRDFDCRAGVNVVDTVSAGFRLHPTSVPHHLTIGAGTIQKGHHAYYCNSESNSVAGGFVLLDSVRWEQPSVHDTTAFLHTPKRKGGRDGHVTERFTMINCRNSNVERSLIVENTLKSEIIGCWLSGTKSIIE